MLHFECDYTEGAMPEVMDALVRTNEEQTSGYGVDAHCENARALIRELCRCADADVHFVTGGTQANTIVIAAALRPFESVLCADAGHINVHETGAIEATGHKVTGLPSVEGKISASQIKAAVLAQRTDDSHEHIARPAMVYLSHPTELGTLYTKEELAVISRVCREEGLALYVDGARLAYGLAAMPEVSLPFLCECCDAFTIGGTKVGLLFGEAIVLPTIRLREHFRYHIKQRGGMLAKGRLLGVQFEAALSGGLMFERAREANQMAQELKAAFVRKGCALLPDTLANQIFPVLPNEWLNELRAQFVCSTWQKVDDTHTAVRFCTSVTTARAEVDSLLAFLSK